MGHMTMNIMHDYLCCPWMKQIVEGTDCLHTIVSSHIITESDCALKYSAA